MPMLTGSYATGTASVANGATTVTLTGGITTPLVPGDPFYSGNAVGLINSITDNTHFELALPWAGTTAVNAAFVVPYLGAQRYQSAYNGQKVRQLLTLLDGIGVIYYVPSTQSVPDPANGNDGDFALKIVPGSAFTFFQKTAGVWVNLGQPVGIANQGFWSSTTAYKVNDIVSRLGVLYIATALSTNQAPEAAPTYWQTLLAGGNRYDLAFDASDRPDSGDTFRRFVFTASVQYNAGMAESRAIALVAATASAVFSIKKNGTQFATVTFAAGGTTGTFACATTTTFAPGDVLTLTAPNPRDATLATIAITMTGYR
jgi:hypothetical protein